MRPPHEPVPAPSPEPSAERTQALPTVQPAPVARRDPGPFGSVANPGSVEAVPARLRLTEAQVLRYGLTVLALVASLGLIVTVGLTLPGVPWLPWLIGTGVYGVLGVRVWIAQQRAEQEIKQAAQIRADNARRARFAMPPGVARPGEPVNDDGSWAT